MAGCGFEIVEFVHQKELDRCTSSGDSVGVQSIEATATGPPVIDQPGVTKEPEMLRDGWTGDINALGEVPDGRLAQFGQ